MKARPTVKAARDFLREAARCTKCGKPKVLLATAWSGRRSGSSSNYRATQFEKPSPETHCVCPPENGAAGLGGNG